MMGEGTGKMKRDGISRPAGGNGFGAFFYRHNGPGIGLGFAEQVSKRQAQQEVDFAIGDDLVEHPERPPYSHPFPPREVAENSQMPALLLRVAGF